MSSGQKIGMEEEAQCKKDGDPNTWCQEPGKPHQRELQNRFRYTTKLRVSLSRSLFTQQTKLDVHRRPKEQKMILKSPFHLFNGSEADNKCSNQGPNSTQHGSLTLRSDGRNINKFSWLRFQLTIVNENRIDLVLWKTRFNSNTPARVTMRLYFSTKTLWSFDWLCFLKVFWAR